MTELRHRINRPQAVAESVNDEIVAINMATGVYFNMRGWSAYAWALLSAGYSATEAEHLLAAASNADVSASLTDFLQALLDDGLLVPDLEATPSNAPAAPTTEWDGLRLERFTDMADLILLDPVHDVDTAEGWPKVEPD
jgi:hypothetical protein